MLIRPVTLDDQEVVLKLAKAAGIGMTSLPPDEEVLLTKILRSVKSFEGKPDHDQGESFLFVLEDPDTNEVVGTTGIKAHIGLTQPFYSYKLTTITQSSNVVSHYSKHQMLQVTNDLTGASEIGSLYLLPEYRRDRLGKMLSRGRFLFMATFPEYFDERVIAEMRGVNDRAGNAPFYDALAKTFFGMEFHEADYLNATQGNQFIADLMPKYPIYVGLLPKTARDVIGQPFPSSEPAKAMLEKEGFRHEGYVDIFDGGPTLQVRREEIKTIKQSQVAIVKAIEPLEDGPKYMICNTQFAEFRLMAARLGVDEGEVMISPRTAEALQLKVGDKVRYAIH